MYYFPGQVGQGKIKWEDAAAHALLRDTVLGNWPKDEAGWQKTLSREDEAAYVGGLVAEERHAVSGLGGSQKAEVAWLDKHGIPYKEVDVLDFIDEAPTVAPKETPLMKSGQTATQVYPIHEEDDDETTEVVSLVELGAGEVASCEHTDTSTGLEKVVEEETAAKDDGHKHEHKQGDAHLVHEQQQGQGRGQPTKKTAARAPAPARRNINSSQKMSSGGLWLQPPTTRTCDV